MPSFLYSGSRTDLIDISSSVGFVDPKGGSVQLSRLVDGDATAANGAGWFPQWSDGNYLEFRFPPPGKYHLPVVHATVGFLCVTVCESHWQ